MAETSDSKFKNCGNGGLAGVERVKKRREIIAEKEKRESV